MKGEKKERFLNQLVVVLFFTGIGWLMVSLMHVL